MPRANARNAAVEPFRGTTGLAVSASGQFGLRALGVATCQSSSGVGVKGEAALRRQVGQPVQHLGDRVVIPREFGGPRPAGELDIHMDLAAGGINSARRAPDGGLQAFPFVRKGVRTGRGSLRFTELTWTVSVREPSAVAALP